MQGHSTLKIMAFLGFLQGLAGIMRAFNWLQVGVNLFGQGLLLLPLVGAVAVLRGLFVSAVALLYMLFAVGALLGKAWCRWLGLTAAVVNLLLVLSVVAQGATIGQVIAWSVIPLILVIYLSSNAAYKAIRAT
jgi:hypothetical protein